MSIGLTLPRVTRTKQRSLFAGALESVRMNQWSSNGHWRDWLCWWRRCRCKPPIKSPSPGPPATQPARAFQMVRRHGGRRPRLPVHLPALAWHVQLQGLQPRPGHRDPLPAQRRGDLRVPDRNFGRHPLYLHSLRRGAHHHRRRRLSHRFRHLVGGVGPGRLGQDFGGLLRPLRDRIRQHRGQRLCHGRLHQPHDETQRLLGQASGRRGSHFRGRRPDHAPHHGRRQLHHGRGHRGAVFHHHQDCRDPGLSLLSRRDGDGPFHRPAPGDRAGNPRPAPRASQNGAPQLFSVPLRVHRPAPGLGLLAFQGGLSHHLDHPAVELLRPAHLARRAQGPADFLQLPGQLQPDRRRAGRGGNDRGGAHPQTSPWDS